MNFKHLILVGTAAFGVYQAVRKLRDTWITSRQNGQSEPLSVWEGEGGNLPDGETQVGKRIGRAPREAAEHGAAKQADAPQASQASQASS